MVAEAYSLDNDPAQAVRRLSFLGPELPSEIVRQAILFAENQGYTDSDVTLMKNLERNLETFLPALQGGSP
jgi:hypothetical protein